MSLKAPLARLALLATVLCAFSASASAQFREEAFNQSYNNPSDSTAAADSIDKMWSFKEFFRGISHKDSLRIGSMFGGATVFIGAEQIYNRQYWKLPLVYGGLGATLGLGFHYRSLYNSSGKTDERAKKMMGYMFAGAGLVYWGTLMDGIVNYKRKVPRQPGKATVYSILLPGLGQAYNGEYWKIPVYWGGLIGSYHFLTLNNLNYHRFKRIHNEATDPEGEYNGPIPAERALYYRDVFRRMRDYSIVAMMGFYLLQVIDANVFAYMRDFEVAEDMSVSLAPAVITPLESYASTGSPFAPRGPAGFSPQSGAFGLRLGITF